MAACAPFARGPGHAQCSSFTWWPSPPLVPNIDTKTKTMTMTMTNMFCGLRPHRLQTQQRIKKCKTYITSSYMKAVANHEFQGSCHYTFTAF